MVIKFKHIIYATCIVWVVTMALLTMGVEIYYSYANRTCAGAWCDGRAVNRDSSIGPGEKQSRRRPPQPWVPQKQHATYQGVGKSVRCINADNHKNKSQGDLEACGWVKIIATGYAHTCTMRGDGEPDLPRPGANGEWPIPNYTIAADPSIPFGTEVLISHGNRVYEMVVGDRGRAIIGNRIDVFLESCEAAIRFGRRTAWAQWQ